MEWLEENYFGFGEYWAYLGTFLGAFVLAYASWRTWHSFGLKNARLIQLHRLDSGLKEGDEEGPDLHLALGLPLERFSSNHSTAESLARNPWALQLATLLDKSGSEQTLVEYIRQSLLISLGGAVVFFFLMGFTGVIVGGAGALLFSYMSLKSKVDKREKQFNALLPEALGMLAMYLKAGQSLPQAFGSASKQLGEPVGPEFEIVISEYNAGRSLVDALRGTLLRYPNSESLRYFLLGVSVLEQAGGNLVSVIESVQQTARMKQDFLAKVRAMTSESRGGAKVLSGLPIAFAGMVTLVNPDYARVLIDEPAGWAVLGVMAVLWSLGLLSIRALLNTEDA